MVQALPYKDIKFSNDTTLETILETAGDASTGYMVELDISFDSSIHEKLKTNATMPRVDNTQRRMVQRISEASS